MVNDSYEPILDLGIEVSCMTKEELAEMLTIINNVADNDE